MSGRKIGRYEIVRELGRGGMATVYLGFDPKLERQVAIKVLPSQFANDPEFFERFQQESKTLAALQHSAIVGLFDSGEEEGFPYFIMQLMNGGSLKDRINEDSLDAEEIITIFSRISAALDKAHSGGIVHRDVKPSNILFDEDGEAYLSDFGIVKLTQAEDGLTRTGAGFGTPHYMSPEQLDGAEDLDGRSDIYALTVVLFEVLTGSPPYDHSSSPRIMVMHLNEPIPDILEKRPNLPTDIGNIIKKGMAKDKEERYTKASEFTADLKAALKDWDPNSAPITQASDETARQAADSPTKVTEKTSDPSVQIASDLSQTPPPKGDGVSEFGEISKNTAWLYALAGAGGVALIILVILGFMFIRNNRNNVSDIAQAEPTESIVIVDPTKAPTKEPTKEATEKPTVTQTATLAPVAISTREATETPRPTSTQEPTETPIPTERPTETSTVTAPPKTTLDDVLIALGKQENVLLFEELFENNQGDSADTKVIFESNELVLTSNAKGPTIAFLPFEKTPDGSYSTEIEFIDGLALEDGWAGIILRTSSNAESYYLFELNGSGSVRGSLINSNGESVRIKEFPTGRIKVGYKVENKLEINIDGNAAEVYINDSGPVATFRDNFLSSGGIGLISRVDQGSNTISAKFSYLTYK